jgi:hypothetical protein
MSELDEASRRLATPKELRPAGSASVGEAPEEKLMRIEAQLGEVRRLIRDAKRSNKVDAAALAPLEKEQQALELRAEALRSATGAVSKAGKLEGEDLPSVIARDRERATKLYNDARPVRAAAEKEQLELARDALARLDKRLSRLLARARLGRIETVLGKKRALEVEIEALSQGYLPQSLVDSLDAARYLRDDEEYWPFDGEDWTDEYVGGEGLR